MLRKLIHVSGTLPQVHEEILGSDTDCKKITADELRDYHITLGEPFVQDEENINDGYHTFKELYRYRKLYNAAFFNLLPKDIVLKSKRHSDGEECFGGGWFIVQAELPTGQISNHYEMKDWELFKIPEKERANKWDGHTPEDVAKRIEEYVKKYQ